MTADNHPALEGGIPVREKRLPFFRTSHGEKEIQAVVETLRSGWLTMGPKTAEFRHAFLQHVDLPHGFPLNSCTSCMLLALKVLGIGKGHEVITTPNTFTSSVNVIHQAGAVPVLVDIEDTTFGIDPAKIEAAITHRTKAVLAVHYGGQPCYIENIKAITDRHGLFLIEDAAHSFSSLIGTKHPGGFGHIGAFSFYVTKNLSTGEGGFLTCKDKTLEEEAALMSFHGMNQDAWKRYGDRGTWYYEVQRFGYKFNMTDIQAAMGLVQLQRADELRTQRTHVADRYIQAFQNEAALLLPQTREGARHSWHLFVPQLKPGALRIDRDKFLQALTAEGISPSLHFIPIHHHPAHKEFFGEKIAPLPLSDRFYANCFSLPLFPTMLDEEIDQVIAAVYKLIDYYRK